MGVTNPPGVLFVGAIDSEPASSNGLVVSLPDIYAQSASATNAGMVNTTTQTFTGAKTFSNPLTVSSSVTLSGATSGTLQISAPATVTSYSLTLPNAQGSAGNVPYNDGSGNINWAASSSDPFNAVSIFDDMTWGNEEANIPTGPSGLVPGGSAGGGIVVPANVPASTAGRWGVIGFDLGTNNNSTANGYAFSDYAQYYCGQTASLTLQFAVCTPTTLSDGTNTYVMELGFRNSLGNSLANNAAAILYQSSTSSNWQAYTSNNATATTLTSSTAVVANTWYNFKIVLTSTTADFYVWTPGNSPIHIGQSTTNLPDSTHPTYMCFIIYKAATFAVNRIFSMDWVKIDTSFASTR